jgi:NTP pyrophosphatase (non-canonical NTP hydrolase)
MSEIEKLRDDIRKFAEERDWDQFHSPKNLSMALAVEASEIMEIFQWLTEEQSRKLPDDKLLELSDELADVAIYLIQLADKLGIDLLSAAEAKIARNKEKYPAEKVRGSAKKYTEYK